EPVGLLPFDGSREIDQRLGLVRAADHAKPARELGGVGRDEGDVPGCPQTSDMLLLVAHGGLVVAFERSEFGEESVLPVVTALLVAFGGGERERPRLLESAKGAEEVSADETGGGDAELVDRLQRLVRWCRPRR